MNFNKLYENIFKAASDEEVEERKAREIIYQKKLANKVKKELKESDKVRKWLYGYPNEKFGG